MMRRQSAEGRRRLAAWVLLWVFVPMMVLTAVHIHHEAVALSDSCHECVNHVPHGGHLSASGFSVDDCLICQTAALPYLMATTVAAVVVSVALKSSLPDSQNGRLVYCIGHQVPGRSPPAVS